MGIQEFHDAKLKLICFTNSPRRYALRCLEFLGLRRFFPEDHVFAVEDVLPACKPQAVAFEQVLRSVGTVPERTVMFEDSMKNVRACAALGIRTVLIDEGGGGEAVCSVTHSIHQIQRWTLQSAASRRCVRCYQASSKGGLSPRVSRQFCFRFSRFCHFFARSSPVKRATRSRSWLLRGAHKYFLIFERP